MKRLFAYGLALLLLASCSEENSLSLSLNSTLTDYLPNYSTARSFVGTDGDTITLKSFSSNSYFQRSTGGPGTSGSLGDLDYLELENRDLTFGSDTPYFRFNYTLSSEYSAELGSMTKSTLKFSFEEESGIADANIELTYTDTLRCVSQRCTYQDTVKILHTSFTGVYFTARDGVSRNALYIDASNGLIGFKTSDNKIYELIP